MAIAVRQAEITWDGPLAQGGGLVSTGSGALSGLPVTYQAAFERHVSKAGDL
jgi:hypothetical protein